MVGVGAVVGVVTTVGNTWVTVTGGEAGVDAVPVLALIDVLVGWDAWQAISRAKIKLMLMVVRAMRSGDDESETFRMSVNSSLRYTWVARKHTIRGVRP